MISALIVILLTSMACSILGVFIVQRKLSMITDAISHTVLLGIVIAFFIVKDLDSPFLIIGATVMGVISVYLIEMLGNSRFAKHEDAIGIIFPLLFSIAVILVSKYFRNVHLDMDMVLMGEVIFSSLDTINVFGFEISKHIISTLVILIIIILFVSYFYKELKVSTFDEEYAKLIRIPVKFIFYGLMTLISLTSVVSFNSVGAILVISFFVAPAATALILTKDLKHTIYLSIIIAMINSIIGYYIAIKLNVSISGMCAVINMFTYIFTILYNRRRIAKSR